MRVSQNECLRISQLRPVYEQDSTAEAHWGGNVIISAYGGDVLPAGDRDLLSATVQKISEEPEVRDQVIASLRERIEAGAYFVSGEQIAEMMIRRLMADTIR